MKHFVMNDNSVYTKLHLVDTIVVGTIGNTPRYVNVYVNGCVHLVYNGKNAEEFAAELAKEVDAAEDAHIAKLFKESGKIVANCAAETDEIKVADDDEKPITDINGKTIEPIQIAALYINEFGDVRAILADDEIVTLKQFENTEKDNYIDALARRCNLYTVSNFELYVDPVSVKKVFISDGDDTDYAVFVMIYDFDLTAATFDDWNDAMTTLKKLKKDLKLE